MPKKKLKQIFKKRTEYFEQLSVTFRRILSSMLTKIVRWLLMHKISCHQAWLWVSSLAAYHIWKERKDSCKLSSDPHTCAVHTSVSVYTHTQINEHNFRDVCFPKITMHKLAAIEVSFVWAWMYNEWVGCCFSFQACEKLWLTIVFHYSI